MKMKVCYHVAAVRDADKMQGMFVVRSDVHLNRESSNNIKRIARKSTVLKIKLRTGLLMKLKSFKYSS
jgi:hypothetical protein